MTLLQFSADLIAAILSLCGVSSIEELSEDELERYRSLSSRPVCINVVPQSRLLSCGIFSPYQVASLVDFRERSGDILSFAELSLVDGFGEQFIQQVRHFISLESYSAPGHSSSAHHASDHEGLVRTTISSGYGYASKYRAVFNDRWMASAVLKSTVHPSLSAPDIYGFSASCDLRKVKIIAGDFVCRFGQGLALWNSFSLSGFSSAGAYYRNPTGASPYWGFSDTYLRGLASCFSLGKCSLTGAFSVKDWISAANASWYFRHGQLAATALVQTPPGSNLKLFKTSADFRAGFRGVDFCGEICADWLNMCFATTLSSSFKLSQSLKASLNLRMYPDKFDTSLSGASSSSSKCSNEAGGAVGLAMSFGDWLNLPSGTSARRFTSFLCADYVMNPVSKDASVKYSTQLKPLVTAEIWLTGYLKTSVRASFRLRNYGRHFKADIRDDMVFDNGKLFFQTRLNYVRCISNAFLAFADQGCKTEKFSIYLRQGLFVVDNWDDRIYAYERTAPGNFKVPSYYGRGLWFSAFASFRLGRWGKLSFRAGRTLWPEKWNSEKKPGKTELDFQLNVHLHGKS